jgi:hypothetical protein
MAFPFIAKIVSSLFGGGGKESDSEAIETSSGENLNENTVSQRLTYMYNTHSVPLSQPQKHHIQPENLRLT